MLLILLDAFWFIIIIIIIIIIVSFSHQRWWFFTVFVFRPTNRRSMAQGGSGHKAKPTRTRHDGFSPDSKSL